MSVFDGAYQVNLLEICFFKYMVCISSKFMLTVLSFYSFSYRRYLSASRQPFQRVEIHVNCTVFLQYLG